VAFLAFSIVLITLLAIGAVWKRIGRADVPWIWPLLVAVPAWAGVSALCSAVPLLGLRPWVWALGAAALVGVVASIGREKPLSVLLWLFVPVVPNVVVYTLQEANIWNPFISELEFQKFIAASGRPMAEAIHGISIGLLGNPTDVAGFLIAPTLVLFTLAMIRHGKARVVFLIGVAALFTIVVTTQILTAAAALGAGILTLVLVQSRHRIRVAIVILMMVVGLTALSTPLRLKVRFTIDNIMHLRFEQLATGRMTAFVPAWQMAMDHKIAGVGPGAFAFHFLDYTMRAQDQYPWLIDSPVRGVNFGEVHNDHLQILAEQGFPGYLLFLASLAILASGTFRRTVASVSPAVDQRQEFSRVISLPLAVSIAVYSMAQFPLELPAVFIGLFFVGGLAIAWRPRETA
jgi:O-antigen ligase